MKYTVQFPPTLYKYEMYISVNMLKDCAKNLIIVPPGGQVVEARIGFPVFIDLSGFTAHITKSTSGTNCLNLFMFTCFIGNQPCSSLIYTISSSTKKLKIYTNDFNMVGTVH